jgi:hypothetical protein
MTSMHSMPPEGAIAGAHTLAGMAVLPTVLVVAELDTTALRGRRVHELREVSRPPVAPLRK